ncbi:pyridoxal kinase-like [Patiria miniata]|uniref:Pyridoxal kinase n=1 Tax=Patiria miniata TaxID=46514 RepID=A0A913YZQ1_PATMI|nr:pyridoxal kinase-like [Patiria miniata]
MANVQPERRVLSIQSHVVSGYVGNKSATFPMQVHGYEVDTINSVQLCSHTGYKVFQGQVLNANELRSLSDGLKANDINHYSHLLTGYVGSKSFLREVIEVVKELREKNPDIIYVCDPVMGDNGKFYVPEELMPIYRDDLLPLANMITPNQFEAELLSGQKITNEQSALEAMQILHDKGIQTVILSSVPSGSGTLTSYGTTVKDGKRTGCRVEYPAFDCQFTGTGDLFSALLLVWSHTHHDNLQLALEKTVSGMQAVLQRTLQSAQKLAGPGNKPTPPQRELRLVQSKADLEDPKLCVKATPLQF